MNGEIPQKYIAVDLETTGLSPKHDKIIEIGAIRVEDGIERARFQTLVNPHRKLETDIVELTGISDEMVEGAQDIADILDSFLAFCGDLPLLGHHIIFDYSFLKHAAVNLKRQFERSGIDTLKLCRRFMPEEQHKGLEAACGFYGIKREHAHRALEDAEAAHRLYRTLVAHHGAMLPEVFTPKPLIYKVKRDQMASERQKQGLRDLLKYHKIDLPVQIDYLSKNEISRIKDKLILQYGKIR